MSQVMMILLRDGLQMPSGTVVEASYDQVLYCRVPDDWVTGAIPESDDLWLKGLSLTPPRMESLLETLYGATWRSGNSDGSQYVVLGSGSRLLNPRFASAQPWQQDDPSDPEYRFLHYVADDEGRFQRVLPSDF